jgi:hypothetical protein
VASPQDPDTRLDAEPDLEIDLEIGLETGEEPPAPDAAAVLALLEAERSRAARALEPDLRMVYGPWGAAWLIGFLAFWTSATHRWPGLSMGAAGVGFGVVMVTAMVVSTTHLIRRTSGVRGPSARVGAMIGWTWSLAFLGLGAVMAGVSRAGAGPELVGLLWSVLSGLVVGIIYLASGAVWQDRVQFGFGAWVLITSSAGALAGYPAVYLVMALAGGGGFLLAAGYQAVRGRRPASGPEGRR